MMSRFVAALLVISLTACSSVPRAMPPAPGTGAPSAEMLEAQPENNVVESSDANMNPEPKPTLGPAKIVVAVLLIALVVVGLAAVSSSLSRDFARSCCRAK